MQVNEAASRECNISESHRDSYLSLFDIATYIPVVVAYNISIELYCPQSSATKEPK